MGQYPGLFVGALGWPQMALPAGLGTARAVLHLATKDRSQAQCSREAQKGNYDISEEEIPLVTLVALLNSSNPKLN